MLPGPPEAAKPKSVVLVWCEGLAWSVPPLICQQLACAFGMEVVPAKVKALRSKAKRLVARGWLAEPAPGRFTLAKGVAGPGGGS
ncbi:hypothetical protein [Streptomyces sp. NPDC002676]